MNWLFGSHPLWWDTLLILDTAGRGLVLPQLGLPDFVDSPREVLHPLRSGWGWSQGEVAGQERGERGTWGWYIK